MTVGSKLMGDACTAAATSRRTARNRARAAIWGGVWGGVAGWEDVCGERVVGCVTLPHRSERGVLYSAEAGDVRRLYREATVCGNGGVAGAGERRRLMDGVCMLRSRAHVAVRCVG